MADAVPSRSRIPLFVTRPPTAPSPDLELELAGIEDRALRSAIEAYWDVALAPYWPRLRALLDGEVLYRAKRLADSGASTLLNDLDSQVTWEDTTLRIAHPHVAKSLPLDGRGLLLAPSVFAWPRVHSISEPGWQPTLRYPPRGIGTLWEGRAGEPSEALAGVLGRTRARLLGELDTPVSTTGLAARTGLAAGGVSAHLTALRDAGLVRAHRAGRIVLYARTEIGERLLQQVG